MRFSTTRLVAGGWVVAVMVGIGWFSAPSRAESQAPAAEDVARELRELYEADQADRRFSEPPTPEEWRRIVARDRQRRERVMELVRGGALASADDYYHAAMVLQHGEGSEDILIAHVLATVAGFEGHESGRWLSAAALDRYLHRTGEPQRLGTQYVRDSAEEPWSQGDYVRWLPDSVRAAYGVPPLQQQEQRLREMNATPGHDDGR